MVLAASARVPPMDFTAAGGVLLPIGCVGACVDGGETLMEREVDVTVVRVLQTIAGRMVFVRPR